MTVAIDDAHFRPAGREPSGDLRAPPRGHKFRAMKLDVLRVDGDRIVEITTFGPDLFEAFGLSQTVAG